MSAPLATSAIKTSRTNVIGIGLRLKSRVNKDVLKWTSEAADAWEKKVEAEFELWAGDKRACDATGINDFYAMQQLAYVAGLLSGDSFALPKQAEPTLLKPYALRLLILEADRVSTPNEYGTSIVLDGPTIGRNKKTKNIIYDGVEVDSEGAIVAYHVNNNVYDASGAYKKKTWTRVEAYGANTGLPNVLHIMDSERPEQYRGVSYIAHIIEPLLQLRRYTESELMAAVVESFFTVFIKTEASTDTMPYNTATPENDGQTVQLSDPNDYEMGPGMINVMKPGEDVLLADPKRPANGFGGFVRSVCDQIGAALEIPADLLLKAFNASYSASRAALLEAWKAFKMRRTWFVSDFCKPVYELWLSEAIARGRISAPGFFNDPILRAAYLGSEWVGPSQGQLDPIKEVQAEELACKNGFSTREQSTVRLNGGQWDSNIEQNKLENAQLAEANRALMGGGEVIENEENEEAVARAANEQRENRYR